MWNNPKRNPGEVADEFQSFMHKRALHAHLGEPAKQPDTGLLTEGRTEETGPHSPCLEPQCFPPSWFFSLLMLFSCHNLHHIFSLHRLTLFTLINWTLCKTTTINSEASFACQKQRIMITLEMQYNKTMALKSLLDMLHLEDSEPNACFFFAERGDYKCSRGVKTHQNKAHSSTATENFQ